jgi:hypothetical protein
VRPPGGLQQQHPLRRSVGRNGCPRHRARPRCSSSAQALPWARPRGADVGGLVGGPFGAKWLAGTLGGMPRRRIRPAVPKKCERRARSCAPSAFGGMPPRGGARASIGRFLWPKTPGGAPSRFFRTVFLNARANKGSKPTGGPTRAWGTDKCASYCNYGVYVSESVNLGGGHPDDDILKKPPPQGGRMRGACA